MGGTDAAAFNIAADGTVTFKTAPDYEVDPTSYSFTVTADDGNGGTAIQTVTVNVNDVTEGTTPVIPPTPTGGVVLDFEGYTDNGNGTFALPDGDYETYGTSMGRGVQTIKEIDGTTDRTMLVVEKEALEWWSGVTLASGYLGTDMIGNGTSPITMRVYAEQDGNLNLELEAPGQAYIMNQVVTQGWNDVVFDVSGADANVNWNKVQLRPDALGKSGNDTQSATTKYYIDDVHFALATFTQQPAGSDNRRVPEWTAAAPDDDPADVVSLFSNAYTSALNNVAATGWSDAWSVTEMAINNGNTVKKFDATVFFAGFDVPGDVTVVGMDSVSISLYRTASSDFEIKMVDLSATPAKDAFYYIPASQMPVNQWVTIDIPLSSFDLNGRDSVSLFRQITRSTS